MRAEVAALAQLLESAGVVHVGDVPPDAERPYIRLVPQRNADEQARFTGPHSSEVVQVAVGSVGVSPDQALWLDERVDGLLRPAGMGVQLEVPGRACSRVERRSSDLSSDDSSERVWQAVSLYRLTSRPV